MSNLTITEVSKLKADIQAELSKIIMEKINKFCEETQLDVEYVGVTLTDVAGFGERGGKYLVTVIVDPRFRFDESR